MCFEVSVNIFFLLNIAIIDTKTFALTHKPIKLMIEEGVRGMERMIGPQGKLMQIYLLSTLIQTPNNNTNRC